MTQGLWNAKDNEATIAVSAGLLSMVSQLTAVNFTHVKSHSNEPWNEAADKVCDQRGMSIVKSFNVAVLAPWVRRPAHAELHFH